MFQKFYFLISCNYGFDIIALKRFYSKGRIIFPNSHSITSINSLPVIQNYCFEIRLYPDAKNRVKPAVELDAKRLLRTDIYHKVVPGDLVEKPGYRGILWHRCVGSNNAVDLLSVSASVNAPQMGDKRRRPILPIKRTRARYGEKKKKRKTEKEKEEKGKREKIWTSWKIDFTRIELEFCDRGKRGTPFCDTCNVVFHERMESIVALLKK